MPDFTNMSQSPDRTDFEKYIAAPAFGVFCNQIEQTFHTSPVFEFSRCSMEYGWNMKYKKSGKSLCTIYPREGYFTAMVVIGRAEKERAEAILPDLSPRLKEIYEETKEGNGQRWLMIDIEDADEVLNGALALIKIRAEKPQKK